MLSKEQQELFYKKLGTLIRAARERSENHNKQEVLSKQVGLSRASIVQIEKGIQKVQLHTLIQIAKCLQVEVNELIPPLESLQQEQNAKLVKKMDKEPLKDVDTADSKTKLTEFLKISANR